MRSATARDRHVGLVFDRLPNTIRRTPPNEEAHVPADRVPGKRRHGLKPGIPAAHRIPDGAGGRGRAGEKRSPGKHLGSSDHQDTHPLGLQGCSRGRQRLRLSCHARVVGADLHAGTVSRLRLRRRDPGTNLLRPGCLANGVAASGAQSQARHRGEGTGRDRRQRRGGLCGGRTAPHGDGRIRIHALRRPLSRAGNRRVPSPCDDLHAVLRQPDARRQRVRRPASVRVGRRGNPVYGDCHPRRPRLRDQGPDGMRTRVGARHRRRIKRRRWGSLSPRCGGDSFAWRAKRA